jgi:hypothetical protein
MAMAAIASLVLLSHTSSCATVEVNVDQELMANISMFSYNSSNDLVKFMVEAYNTGSVPVVGKVRVDIINSSSGSGHSTSFTAWGDEKTLMPGEKQLSTLYYHTAQEGTLITRVRFYYSNEQTEKSFLVIKANVDQKKQDTKTLSVKGVRTYDDRLAVDLQSIEDTNGVVLVPNRFPAGWVVGQIVVGDMRGGESKTVFLPFKPSLFLERNVSLIVSNFDGSSFSEESFVLKKESGIRMFVGRFLDDFRTWMSGQ